MERNNKRRRETAVAFSASRQNKKTCQPLSIRARTRYKPPPEGAALMMQRGRCFVPRELRTSTVGTMQLNVNQTRQLETTGD